MNRNGSGIRGSRTQTLGLVLLCSAIGILATTSRGSAAGFRRWVVDANGGEFSSIALNSAGRPCISYYGAVGLGNLRYAEMSPDATWTTLTVDNDYLVGGHTSIVLNGVGDPRISFRDGVTNTLKIAERNGGVWIRTYVDGPDAGQYTSIVLDSLGQPRISHYDTNFNNLKYSERNSGVWSNYYVDGFDGLNAGSYTSLALDAAENPHISYYDATNGNLKHAFRVGGTWNFEVVDGPPGVSVGAFTSIKIKNNIPRISYRDETNGRLKFAEKLGPSWTITTVDADGRVGGYSSLALDAGGNPHIAYFDFTHTAVKYALRVGGVWSTQFVDSVGWVGEHCALAVTGDGQAYISYYDSDNHQLRAATNDPVLVGVDETPALPGVHLSVRANPTAGAAEVAYSIPVAGRVTLRVYDAAGRLVEQTADEMQAAGPHRARIGSARPAVPSGVYYLSLNLDGRPVGRQSFVVRR